MEGIFHSEFVLRGQMVTSSFYKVLQHLREAIWWKIPKKWWNSWIFYHSNTPCHTSLCICQFLTCSLLSQPVTAWLLAVPQIKRNYVGEAIWHDRNVISNMTHHPWIITKEDFQKCSQQWQECWNKCVCWRGMLWKGLMMKKVFNHSLNFLLKTCIITVDKID